MIARARQRFSFAANVVHELLREVDGLIAALCPLSMVHPTPRSQPDAARRLYDETRMIGARLREVRQSQERSLADIAGEAGISVATLSRIENDKQTLELGMFLVIARVLKTAPKELLGTQADALEKDPLARQIASLGARERTELWRDLAAEQRARRSRSRAAAEQQIGAKIDELLAQLEFLREELESIKKRSHRR
jgi:transcriptional regulator with XRE-family HTH domain